MSELTKVTGIDGNFCTVLVVKDAVSMVFADDAGCDYTCVAFTSAQAYDLGRAIEMARREIDENRIELVKEEFLSGRARCEEIALLKQKAMYR